MAVLVLSASASWDTFSASHAPQISDGLIAGEDLGMLTPCYVKSDGKVWKSDGTSANAAAHVDGFSLRHVHSGEPVTLAGLGLKIKYTDTLLTPGAIYYLAAGGGLDTATTTGDSAGTCRAVTSDLMRVIRIF